MRCSDFQRWARGLALGLGLALVLGLAESAGAADSRDALLFEVNTAVRSNDRAELEKCFNLAGVDEATKAGMLKIIDRICSWPTHYVKTSERAGTGSINLTQDGKTMVLNGDWTYQVHIYENEQARKGYVFPAGTARDGSVLILVAEQSTPH